MTRSPSVVTRREGTCITLANKIMVVADDISGTADVAAFGLDWPKS